MGGGGGGRVNLTSAPGPGLCFLLRSSEMFRDLLSFDSDWTWTGSGPDLDRSLTINAITSISTHTDFVCISHPN